MAVANSRGVRAAERRTASQLLTVMMGPDGGTGYAEAAAVDATAHRRRGPGPRGGRARPARPPNPVALAAGRLPGGAGAVRRRRPAGHAGLPRVLRARGGGGPLVRGAGPARRLAARDASATTRRDPAGLPASFDYEGVAKQRGAARRGGRLPGPWSTTRQTAARAGRRSTGHGAAGTQHLRAVPAATCSWPPATRRATSSSAGWSGACSSPASTTRTRSIPSSRSSRA